MTPARDDVFELADDVRFRRVADEGVVLVQERALVVGVNDPGERLLAILRARRGRATYGEIVDALAREYDVTPERLDADVPAFLEALVSRGVVARGRA